MKMRKQALSEQAEFALNGLAIGAGTAGVVALIRQLAEAKRQQDLEKKRKSAKISPNTIVLRVRKSGSESEKNASAGSVCNNGCKKVSVKPCVESKEVHPLAEGQLRETNGRFTTLPQKEAQAKDDRSIFRRIWDEGSGLYLGGAAAVGGFYLVHKLAEKLEQNRLKKQLEAAQTEYLDLLDGKTVKGAEAFSDMFLFNNDGEIKDLEKQAMASMGLEKDAGVISDIKSLVNNVEPTVKHLGAGAVCTYLLGITGSAYVAKKLMEQRFDSQDKEEKPNDHIKILMKAGESTFEVQPEQVLATISIMRDCIRDSIPIHQDLEKSAFYDGQDPFMQLLENDYGGRQKILDAYAAMHGLAPEDSLFSAKDMNAIFGGMQDPERLEMVQGAVFNNMKQHPEQWFHLLGNSRYKNLLNQKALEYFYQNHPVASSIPIFNEVMTNYLQNSATARKGIGQRFLTGMAGMSEDAANELVNRYAFSPEGWQRQDGSTPVELSDYDKYAPWITYGQQTGSAQPAPAAGTQNQQALATPTTAQPKPATAQTTGQPGANAVKTASSFSLSPNDILAFAARQKTVTDIKNTDISRKIDLLMDSINSKKKNKGDSNTVVEIDPELKKLLSDKDIAAITRYFSGANQD